MIFHDRVDAGRRLANALQHYAGQDVVIYALPRGGVVLGAEVARALHAPLDVIITRKVGHPLNPEYGICAVSEDGHMVCNEAERASVDAEWFRLAVAREREEAARRRERYLAGRASVSIEGRTAIIVDDGIATGLTMFAAIEEVRHRHPGRIVVAIPVIPAETAERLRAMVDDVVALEIPEVFLGAVGAYYDDFRPVPDEEVIRLLQQDPLRLYALPPYASWASALASETIQPIQVAVSRFANNELVATLEPSQAGDTGILLCTTMPPDVNLLSALLVSHTLKAEGIGRLIAVMPYLAYTRQDKLEPGRSRANVWMGEVMRSSGIDELVTIDIHSQRAADQFPFPVTSLSPAALFAEQIRRNDWTDATIVAPDRGALPRCEEVHHHAAMTAPITFCEKQRSPEGVRSQLQGKAGMRVIMIDDILDTGGTMVACCEHLYEAGHPDIHLMVTHGLFTGDRWQRLWELGVSRIYCTDTVPIQFEPYDPRIVTLSVLPLLQSYLSSRAETRNTEGETHAE